MHTQESLLQTLAVTPWLTGFKSVSCTRAECRRWLTQGHLRAHRSGVTMQGSWYCSYACFASAAAERFRNLQISRQKPTIRTPRMPLPLILIGRGLITQSQLKHAFETQQIDDSDIGQTLLRLGYIAEKDLTAARSTQWNTPVFTGPIHPSAHIPLALMQTYSLAPLHYVPATNNLLIGFLHTIEYAVLYAIEQMTGCKTQACFITPTDFAVQMQHHQSQKLSDDLIFETVQNPSKMAHLLCNYGGLLNADSIAIGRCGHYFWARLTTQSHTSNILFRAA